MYLAKNKHILSTTMMYTALVNIVAEGVNVLCRVLISKVDEGNLPALLLPTVWNGQLIVSILQIAATCLLFWMSQKIISDVRALIPEEDEEEMAKLQMEMIPGNVSVLNLKDTEQLVKIWAAILIGVQVVYDIAGTAYKNIIMEISNVLLNAGIEGQQAYLEFYNSSHGFKYIGMLVAICIGILTTGIFLKDKILVISSAVLTAAFMFAFLILNQSTIMLNMKQIGVVWTSVIFHLLQTAGLLFISLYLRHRYRGI